MELSMSMRYVRIRARQKAKNGPVLAEHTMSALLMLAGCDAKTVMPSGAESAQAAISNEIDDLCAGLKTRYQINDPHGVMAKLDALIESRQLDTGAEREFAAIQAEAENWMTSNPSYGDTIVPIAMLNAVADKIDEIMDETLFGAGDTSGGSVAPAAGAAVLSSFANDNNETVLDTPNYDPNATIVDFTPPAEDEVDEDEYESEPDQEDDEAAEQQKQQAAAKVLAAALAAAAAEKAAADAAEEQAKRDAEEKNEEGGFRGYDEALKQRILQQAVQEAQLQILKERQLQAELERNKKNRKTRVNGVNFKGGPVAAHAQYFVLTILVGFGILIGLIVLLSNAYGGSINAGIDNVPTVWNFLLFVYTVIWGGIVFNGVISAFGQKYKSFAIFLGFSTVTFIAWRIYKEAFADMQEGTWWMKVVFFVVYLIAFIVSQRRFVALRLDPGNNVSQSTMFRIRVIGTSGMIYFRLLITSTIFPAILLLILRLVSDELSAGWEHFFAIYCFCWMLGLIYFIPQSIFSELTVGQLSWDKLEKKKSALVGSSVIGALMLPAFIIFLHWHFDWFPMKVWVLVLLIIYLVFALISIIAAARTSVSSLQND